MKPLTRIFPDVSSLAAAFASRLCDRIAERPRVTIALSGGSTPQWLFRCLAQDYPEKIDWGKVHLFWGDERCVPPEDPESNFRMARELLLRHIRIPSENIHRILGEAEPAGEAERYAEEIREFVDQSAGWPEFDLIILGLGEDGHTASIFPNQMELLQTNAICAVASHPGSGQKRITLTGPVLNQAREVAFLVTGATKADVVQQVLNRKGNWQDLPAAHINPSEGKLLWYLDAQAAGSIIAGGN